MSRSPSLRTGLLAVATAVAVFAVATGCDSRFEDVNSNPNEPEQVTPDLLLPDILRSSVNTSVNAAHSTGNLVLQYVSRVSFATEVDRYNWAGVGYWEAYYDDLRNVTDMIRIARERENPNFEGVGLVMKSWIFSMLTDAYGRIPYSEANTSGENTPVYDPQPAVYEGILADLETANDLIDPGNGQPIQGDILYDGDLLKWKKLANSLRLRLLMRLSEKQGSGDLDINVQEQFRTIVNNPSQNPVFEGNEDNAALEYLGSRPNEWPPHTQRVGTFRTFRMSQTLTDELKTLDDPRLPVFADTTNAPVEGVECDALETYVGVPNGLTDDASNEFNGGRDCQSALNTTKYFDEPNAAKGLIMTHAEVLFLRAEAAARGWTGEDAEGLYESGVQASMDQYGQSMPAGYLDRAGVDYPAGDQARAITRINKQKWIALFYTGMEGWFNWRRTGVPDIEPSADNVNGDQIPVRFRYPESEQSLNAENYDEAVQQQGPNNINTKMWLLEE
ncbi:MAG: SusD/RagB family nutrient-binding outer membrane lipoprotein [Salinivenus sp.]